MDKYGSPMVAYLGALNTSKSKQTAKCVPRAALTCAVGTLSDGGANVPLVAPIFPALCGRVLAWRVAFAAHSGPEAAAVPDILLDPASTALVADSLDFPALAPVAAWDANGVAALALLVDALVDAVAAGHDAALAALSANTVLALDLDFVRNGAVGRGARLDAVLLDAPPRTWPAVACEKVEVGVDRAAAAAAFAGSATLPAVEASGAGSRDRDRDGSMDLGTGCGGGRSSENTHGSLARWAVVMVPLNVDLSAYVPAADVEAAAAALAKDADVHTMRVRVVYELDNGGLTMRGIRCSVVVSEFWVGALAALTLPSRAPDATLLDYIPAVEDHLRQQLPFLAQSRILRQGLIDAMVADADLLAALVEADTHNYLKIAFLIRASKVTVVATITIPPVFPQQRPSVVLASLGHARPPPAIGPVARTYDTYTYSQEWDAVTMVANLKAHLYASAHTFVASLA